MTGNWQTEFLCRRVTMCALNTTLYTMLSVFSLSQRPLSGVEIRCEIDVVLTCVFFLQKSVFFRFFGIGFDLPTSWRGRFRYPLYY
jgi:hypothetical protein